MAVQKVSPDACYSNSFKGTKKTSLLLAIALAVASLTAAPLTPTASAPDTFGIDSTSGYNSLLAYSQIKHRSSGALDPLSVRNRYLKRKGRGGRVASGKGRVASGGSRRILRGSTRFRPSLAVRQRMLANMVAKTRATHPQSAAALQRDFAKGDPIATIAPALARYGLRTDDVADSMAVYLVSAWYGVRGSTQDAPRAQVSGLRAQMHRALLSTPAFASSSNAAKQQTSDALLLQTMMNERIVTSAKGNPAKMASAKNSIRQGALHIFKLDLSKMKLTNQGLRS